MKVASPVFKLVALTVILKAYSNFVILKEKNLDSLTFNKI